MKLEKQIRQRHEQWLHTKGKQVGNGKSTKAGRHDNTSRN
jgi:hypothetical protein